MDSKTEKRLLKRLKCAHDNLVDRLIKEVLNSIRKESSVHTYAKKWIMNPELQKMYKCSSTGIRLDYLRNEGRIVRCYYTKCYCNKLYNENRVLNELLGKQSSEDDYCTCFSYYKTKYETKLRRFGIYSVQELETKGGSVFVIPISKLKTIKYDLRGLNPKIVWKGTYWNPETRLFDNKLHRKAGIRRFPWNDVKKFLLEYYDIKIQLDYNPEYLIINPKESNFLLKLNLFPSDIVSFHIRPFLDNIDDYYHYRGNPNISIFFKNEKEKERKR